jgi:hypothetical protein
VNLGNVPDPFMRMMEQDANRRPPYPPPVVTDRMVKRSMKTQPRDVRNGVLAKATTALPLIGHRDGERFILDAVCAIQSLIGGARRRS